MERPASTKPFAIEAENLNGASVVEAYDKNEEWAQAKQIHNMCSMYAAAYNSTMLNRLQKEKPEFFEENNIDKAEMIVHLTNNMCLPYTKYKNRVFRDTTAKLKETEHLKDQIRRLSNGGDRFHPYL